MPARTAAALAPRRPVAHRARTRAASAAARPSATDTPARAEHRWTFLTNHSHVLILLSQDPTMVLREVAQRVGITERAVQRIIAELEGERFIERHKVGRQNHYRILADKPLRHPIEGHRSVRDLLALLSRSTGA